MIPFSALWFSETRFLFKNQIGIDIYLYQILFFGINFHIMCFALKALRCILVKSIDKPSDLNEKQT